MFSVYAKREKTVLGVGEERMGGVGLRLGVEGWATPGGKVSLLI